MANRGGKPPLELTLQRREQLLAFLREKPNALQKQMAGAIGVSAVAVRSILRTLERQGRVQRVARWRVLD